MTDVVSHEEQERLWTAWTERGDRAALDQLVLANQGLVHRLAASYFRPDKWPELEDLVAQGQIGLLRAVRSWRPGRGASFSTYSFDWIRSAIGHLATRRANREPFAALSDEDALEGPNEIASLEARLTVRSLLRGLRAIDRAVIETRYLSGDEPTLKEAGAAVGMNQPRSAWFCERRGLEAMREHFDRPEPRPVPGQRLCLGVAA